MSKSGFCLISGLAALGLLFAPPVYSQSLKDDPMIAGAKQCTQYLARHERQYGIPMHLLAAIASNESGRYHEGLGIRLPWPWTINAEGQGYYFQTKEEAVAAVQKLQARGMKSIDVGCMQVNLMHHPKAFASLDQAFDPGYNVAYAASFLHNNFTDLKSWRSATGAYHSRTPTYSNKYSKGVFDTWQRILSKIAQAKSGTLAMMRDKWDLPKFSRVTDVDSQGVKPKQYASSKKRSTQSSRENGVLVIRPRNNPVAQSGETQVAMNDTSPVISTGKPTAEEISNGQFSPGAKVVRLGKKSSIAVSKAPQFVFEN